MTEWYLDAVLMFCIFALPVLIIGSVASVLVVWKITRRFMMPFMVGDVLMPFVLSALWMKTTEWLNPHQDLDGYSFITIIGALWALLVIVRFGLTLKFDSRKRIITFGLSLIEVVLVVIFAIVR